MDINRLERITDTAWRVPAQEDMRVPAVIFADEGLIRDMDDKVREQAANVARLPGIVAASYAMPDAHWGYGFPIGGVAAFDPAEGGVVSAGGVGFDSSCGIRTLYTGLSREEVMSAQKVLADMLFRYIPAGLGSTGHMHLSRREMDRMLVDGARWAVAQGYGEERDLSRIEEQGRMSGADPSRVSEKAKKRQQNEMGTLGSGNHYLEVQAVTAIYDAAIARIYGLAEHDVVVSIHCGSRGLGQQIGTEFLKRMLLAAGHHGIRLPRRWPSDEPPRGQAPVERTRGGRRPGPSRRPDPQPQPARCGRGGPGAYKDVKAVVEAADAAGLARKVARLEPLVCIKG